MFHTKHRHYLKDMGKHMNLDMDMDIDMISIAKVMVAGAMIYYGARMIAEEMMD